jgi:hypothetical protein
VDLHLFAGVLWRFRLLVVMGLILAAVLAILSVVRVSGDGLAYRKAELWKSTTRLGVTQSGFPWGRLLADEPTVGEQVKRLGIPFADPNRLNALTVLYAELATSDPVRQLMRKQGPISGKITATPVIVGETRNLLPLIDISAIAVSPQRADRLSQRAASAFDLYLRQQQAANKVPEEDRVVVQEIARPKEATLFRPRPKTMPILIFLSVFFGTVGLAFLLENLRPRNRSEAATVSTPPVSDATPARRSA